MADQYSGDDLDRLWTSAVDGAAVSSEADPKLIEAIRQVRERDHVPPPDAVYVARVRNELVTTLVPRSASGTASIVQSNGHAVVRPWQLWRPLRAAGGLRSGLLSLVTVLLLVVTVGFGVLSFVVGRVSISERSGAESTAQSAPSGVTSRTLAVVKAGNRVGAVIQR